MSTFPASFFGNASHVSTRSGTLNLATPWPSRNVAQIVDSGCRGRGRDDHRARPFARPRVGHPDDRHLGDVRMADEQVLDFLGRDVLAVADDDVLRSTGDDEAVAVPAAEIPGAEVAVVVEGVGLVLGVQIADQHLGAARADLAVDRV